MPVEERWFRLHLAFAPFGTILVTWLLSLGVGAWQWGIRDNLGLAGQLMPMGAACYAAAIVVIERTGRMFWAFTQIKKDRERFRREGLELGREEGLELGREEGLELGREEGLELGREDERTRIERELAERGIELSPEAIEIIRSPVNGSSRNGDIKE